MEASDLSSVPVLDSLEIDFGPWMLVTRRRGRAKGHGDGQNIGSREAHLSEGWPSIENTHSHGSQATSTWTTHGGM